MNICRCRIYPTLIKTHPNHLIRNKAMVFMIMDNPNIIPITLGFGESSFCSSVKNRDIYLISYK